MGCQGDRWGLFQGFKADPGYGTFDGLQRLNPCQGHIHSPFTDAVSEQNNGYMALAREQLFLQDGLDADLEIPKDAGNIGEHPGAIDRAHPKIISGLDVLHSTY